MIADRAGPCPLPYGRGSEGSLICCRACETES